MGIFIYHTSIPFVVSYQTFTLAVLEICNYMSQLTLLWDKSEIRILLLISPMY
jgi:hypothetical protein